MAVVGTAKEIPDSQSTELTSSKTTHTASYQVTVNDPTDGPLTVIAASGIPALVSAFAFGGDTDASTFCVSIGPRRQTRLQWIVTCKWETPGNSDDGGGVTAGGSPTSDPLLYFDRVFVSSYNIMVPVRKARNIETFNGRPAGKLGPVTNSAHTIFDPPPEREFNIEVIRFVSNQLEYVHEWDDYINTVNDDSILIQKFYQGYLQFFAKWTLKCVAIDATFLYQNGVKFWEVTKELHWKSDTWHIFVLDQGIFATAFEGDFDGMGGTISASDAVVKGRPYVRALVDKFGQPVTEPVLFDGAGKPNISPTQPAIYLEYSIYDEKDFDDLGI